jgi:transcriptional regulator with XRE-family HTH domain
MSAREITAIDTQVGERLRSRRQQLKLSQADIAAHLGITQAQLAKYEAGDNRMSVGRLVACASILGVSLNYFVDADMGKIASTDQLVRSLSANEQILVDQFRRLSHQSALQIVQLISRFSELEK